MRVPSPGKTGDEGTRVKGDERGERREEEDEAKAGS